MEYILINSHIYPGRGTQCLPGNRGVAGAGHIAASSCNVYPLIVPNLISIYFVVCLSSFLGVI